MRDQADKLKRPAAGISKLVQLVGPDEDDRPGGKRVFDVAFEHNAGAFEHEDLMLVGMGMLGGISAGGDFELPHTETGRSVALADEATDPASHGPFHIDGGGFNLLVLNDFHYDGPRNLVRYILCNFIVTFGRCALYIEP